MAELQDSETRDTLDAKIAAEFSRILSGELAKEIGVIEEKLTKQDKLLKGSLIAVGFRYNLKSTFRTLAKRSPNF